MSEYEGTDIGFGVETITEEETSVKQMPMWNVIILNDDDHTYEYVVMMLTQLFKKTTDAAIQHAVEIDKKGQSTIVTVPKEVAELRQEQVHAFGPDMFMSRSAGPMTCIIEPAE